MTVVAVVFAHGFSGDDLDEEYKSRLDAAVELYSKKLSNYFIVTAGHANSKGVYLFELSKDYLISKGIPKNSISCELRAFSTWQEIRNIYSILDYLKPSKVLLVSSDYHLPRLSELFKNFYGLNYVFSSIACNYKELQDFTTSEKTKLERDLLRLNGVDGFSLLPVSEKDSKIILDWRNDPITREQSLTSEEISFEQHDPWFKKKLLDATFRMFLIKKNNVDLGMVRLDYFKEQNVYQVGINVAPNARGQGVGKYGLKLLSFEVPQGSKLIAEVKQSNIASIKAFESQGFSSKDKTKDPILFEKIV